MMNGSGLFVHSAHGVATTTCVPGVMASLLVTSACWTNGWNAAAPAQCITVKVIYYSPLEGQEKR